jgi:tRNA(Ile)-lysidine synthase
MTLEKKIVLESAVELNLYRPLLGVRHAELVAWLVSHGHRWREDATNAEPMAVRNRLRNEALPLLSEISGRDAALAFVRGALDTMEIESLESWALEQAEALDPQGRLHLGAMRKLPPVMQRIVLRKFLMDHQIPTPDRALIECAMSLLNVENPAVINLPGGARFRRREARLWIER